MGSFPSPVVYGTIGYLAGCVFFLLLLKVGQVRVSLLLDALVVVMAMVIPLLCFQHVRNHALFFISQRTGVAVDSHL